MLELDQHAAPLCQAAGLQPSELRAGRDQSEEQRTIPQPELKGGPLGIGMSGHRLAEDPVEILGARGGDQIFRQPGEAPLGTEAWFDDALSQLGDARIFLPELQRAVPGDLAAAGHGHHGKDLTAAVEFGDLFRVVDMLMGIGITIGLVDRLGDLVGFRRFQRAHAALNFGLCPRDLGIRRLRRIPRAGRRILRKGRIGQVLAQYDFLAFRPAIVEVHLVEIIVQAIEGVVRAAVDAAGVYRIQRQPSVAKG